LIQAAIARIDSEGVIEKMSEKAGAAITDKPTSTDDSKDDVVDESSTLKIDVQPSSAVAPSTSPKVRRSNSNSPRPIIPGERVSKRVQSQMLTSEKETERLAKRSNVEYCLLAGTLSCTSQNPNYTRLLKSDFNWDDLPMLRACLESVSTTATNSEHLRNKSINTATSETTHTLGTFVETFSKNNSGPRNLLELFLVYIAMHPSDVFGDGRSDLASCFLDCE
jgi:hypothetical protein